MEHLRSNGISIHLDLPYPLLAERVGSLDARGVVMAPGQTLEALYEERQALYRRYADQTVDCTGLNHEQVVEKILKNLSA
jgi:shikimate kinase